MDAGAIADVIAAENVRRLLDGTIEGIPEEATLAWHVYHAIVSRRLWMWKTH